MELKGETLNRVRVKRIEANGWKFTASDWDNTSAKHKEIRNLKRTLKSSKAKRVLQFDLNCPE